MIYAIRDCRLISWVFETDSRGMVQVYAEDDRGALLDNAKEISLDEFVQEWENLLFRLQALATDRLCLDEKK